MLAGIRAGGATFITFPKSQNFSGVDESGFAWRANTNRPLTVAGAALVRLVLADIAPQLPVELRYVNHTASTNRPILGALTHEMLTTMHSPLAQI